MASISKHSVNQLMTMESKIHGKYSISVERRSMQFANSRGIAIPSRGRPSKEIKEEEVNFCLDYKDKYHVGYQRTAESAKRHNIATTEWSVRKIFTEQKLLCYKKPEKLPKEHLRLFVAKYANQLWHADIHYVTIEGEQFYLLGFIDDRSRFLIYYEVLSSKTSEACTTALIKALGSVVHRPKMLTIDNGGEFTGNPFQFILQLYGIEDYRTHPLYSRGEW
ncbi:IS3 family transposase [Histomonas meleagridis]|uniref:IS3 family transposase n=1 Tax=Histomonas meleagridis TaxID=135588 RepID=UPI00355990FA|nr:IS3 family transposase [Histomonas meleagridis]